MAKRLSVALATVLGSIFLAFFATAASGQTAPARPAASLNLMTQLEAVQRKPLELEAAYKTGSKVAAVCANCHGQGGNSSKLGIPNLAGQNPAYLLEQLSQFADGRRRNEFMEGLIKVLSPAEKIGAVIFYSGQPVIHKPSASAALVSQGMAYYSKICWRCHGDLGRGNEKVARIAGQQADYLMLTLKRYRQGSNIRVEPLMADSTRLMTDADMAAVVAYVSSMK
jgi:cytochrome c553